MKKASLRERLAYLRYVFERLHEAGYAYSGGSGSMVAPRVRTSSQHFWGEMPLTGTLTVEFRPHGGWSELEMQHANLRPWVLLTLEVDDVRDIVVDCDPRLHALLEEEI